MSYGTANYDLHRRAMSYIDRILRGAKPGDLLVQYPTKFDLATTLRSRKRWASPFRPHCSRARTKAPSGGRGMSAISPLLGDKLTSGERAKNDAIAQSGRYSEQICQAGRTGPLCEASPDRRLYHHLLRQWSRGVAAELPIIRSCSVIRGANLILALQARCARIAAIAGRAKCSMFATRRTVRPGSVSRRKVKRRMSHA